MRPQNQLTKEMTMKLPIAIARKESKPKLELVPQVKSENWLARAVQALKRVLRNWSRSNDDLETWRRLEFRSEIPRAREIERSMWRM